MNNELGISRVFDVDGDYTHVSIAGANFSSITGRDATGHPVPQIKPVSEAVNASGDDVKVYDFSGVKLFRCFSQDKTQKPTFSMLTSDVDSIVAKQKKAETARKSGLEVLNFKTPAIQVAG